VLLKNDGNLLPLDKSKLRSLLVIGPFETGFSSTRTPDSPLCRDPLEGIRNKVGPNVRGPLCAERHPQQPQPISPLNPTLPLSSWATIPRATRSTSRARCCQ